MAKRLNILFITPRFPYPPYRGDKLKIYNIIKLLSKNHSISLLAFIQRSSEEEYIKAISDHCESIDTVLIPTYQSYLNCGVNSLNSIPFQVAYFTSRKMMKALSDVLKKKNFDLIHTHLIRTAQYTCNINKPKILDLTDAVSLYMKRIAEVERNPFKKLFFSLEYKRLRRYEKILENYDRCFVCSSKDRDFLLESAPNAKISLLYNGIDVDYFKPIVDVKTEPNTIIFTGNMDYWPNIDGVIYFYSKIFPLIREEMPEVKLYVVGQNPTPKVQRLAGDTQVIVTGRVDDIRPYYAKATVSVCPIRFKGGTLNKILEPLAMGIPVISTSLGVEGLDVTPEKDLLVADSPSDFAKKVICLMRDGSLRAQLADRGRKAVEKYGWEIIVAGLEKIYEEVLSEENKLLHRE